MSSNLDSTLRRINRQTEEVAAEDLAERLGFSYMKLDDYPFNLDTLSLIPIENCETKLYAVITKTSKKARIAIVHPEDKLIMDEITLLGRKWGVELERTVVSNTSFTLLLHHYAILLKEAQANKEAAFAAQQQKEEHNYFNKIKSLDDLRNELEHASITEILDVLIAAAYNQEASDIHLEPGPIDVVVRFRIDGVLQQILALPGDHYKQLLSRIRMLSGTKIDEKGVNQDGRFSMSNKGIRADFRVSIVPTGYGPGVVMRILRQDMEARTLSALGFSEYNLGLIDTAIKRPYGLIVVTGPTGSGKSTTLYAILKQLNSPEKKIITLEDPIEYRLPGLQQSQVNPDGGFTFAEGLKGALRQDPDIIMVGEIRDPETATIALNASLTGHLVISTLHTNDAVTAHVRFLELGVAPFLLSGSVQLIVAQRLVRKVIPGSPPGAPEYKGRVVIAEVLHPSQEFEQAVLAKTDPSTLHDLAIKGGMIPMIEDGMEKVKAGITTEQEVYRVTAV